MVAAVVVLAGCGTDAEGTGADGPTGSDSSASASSPRATEETPVEDEPGKDSGKDDPGKDEPAEEPSVPADAPACAAVWKDGTRLARDYDGCVAGGEFVAVDQESCSFGQRLVRYGDHFYAVRGGPVNRTAAPLSKDRDYRGAIASCRA